MFDCLPVPQLSTEKRAYLFLAILIVLADCE